MTETTNPAAGPSGQAKVHRFSHRAMACVFEVLICGGDADTARDAAEAAFEELERMEKLLSRFNAYSDVGRINAAEVGEPVIVDVETAECLLAARRMWDETGGAFDVTAGAPDPAEGPDEQRAIGMELIEIDADELTVLRRHEGVQVDLGGIGKGFALDRMAESLRDWGVEAALLHGGASTVLALGCGPDGAPWRLALRDPSDEAATALAWVRLQDRALSGSATAHARHITDPRTKRAAAGDRAAWAVAETAAEADALTTAMCVMETDEVQRYPRSHQGVCCILGLYEAGRWRLLSFGPPVLADSDDG